MERVSAPVLRLAAADRALHGRRILIREIPRIHEPAEIIQRFGFDHTVLHIEFLLADMKVAAHQVPEFAAQDESVGLAVGAVHAGQVMPVLSGEFSEKFETYFADHFPQRNMWVGLNSYYNLGIGLNGRNGVYNSADGYLINVPVDKENYVRKNIRVLAEFKEKIGDVPMTVMLAPSTGYIATDKLPLIHDSYNDDTYFAETAKTLGESGVNFVDLRETFKQKYAEGVQLYYRTDHHWTTDGAYEGYVKLCEKLGVQPADKDSFAKTAYGGFYGTTYSTSGYWLTKPDSITVYDNQENTDKNITVKISEDGKDNHYGSMFFYNHIDEDDKYPVFLDGNHALTEIQNKNAKNGTIVVIKDSFSHSLAPFLAENYSKVVLVDLRYYKQSVSDLIKKENPEQVVALYGIDNFATDTDIVWLQ